MSEVVYEETATMIAAGELQSFVPFGREHCRNHPNAFNLQLRELQPASELWSSDGAAGLVGSLQEVSLQERERVRLHGFYIILPMDTSIATSVCQTFKNKKSDTSAQGEKQKACIFRQIPFVDRMDAFWLAGMLAA